MRVRELYAKLSFKFDEEQIKRFDSAMARVKRRVRKFVGFFQTAGKQIVSALGLGAGALFVRRLIETGDLLAKQARQLGMSATQLKAWQHAAELSGVATERFNASLNTFFSQIRGASFGSLEATRVFRKLGISVKDIEKRDVGELLLETADGFAKLETATEKAAFATQLFGESGRAMIPMLELGREGVQELLDEIYDIAGKDGLEAFAKESEEAADALTRFRASTTILSQQIASRFLPHLTSAVKWITTMTRENESLIQSTATLKAFMLTLGIVAVAALAGPLVATLAWLAALAGVFLIAQDIFSFLEGKDSVIGELLKGNRLLGGAPTQSAPGLSPYWAAPAPKPLPGIPPVIDNRSRYTTYNIHGDNPKAIRAEIERHEDEKNREVDAASSQAPNAK